MEVKPLKEGEIVLWSRPQKIKEDWFSAVIEKPIFENRNIQFIMKCKLFEAVETSYIVVSKEELEPEEIESINLKDYIFDNQKNFSRGVKMI